MELVDYVNELDPRSLGLIDEIIDGNIGSPSDAVKNQIPASCPTGSGGYDEKEDMELREPGASILSEKLTKDKYKTYLRLRESFGEKLEEAGPTLATGIKTWLKTKPSDISVEAFLKT